MKGKLALIGVLLAGISFSADKLIIKKPPESLSKYYPPKSKKFEFVSNMHKMSLAFYAVNLNINAENWEKAKEWARNLEKTYKETAKMVPEWKKYFKPELAENFRKAVESQNVDEVIKTSKKLGRNCQKCHQDNMAIVKIMYRFPSFEKIKIEEIRLERPRFLTEDTTLWVFRYTGSNHAMVGYRVRNIFYILWFDFDYTLYKHS